MGRPSKYPPELLERAVRMVEESGRPIAHVARDLGISAEVLRKRVRQAEADRGEWPRLAAVGSFNAASSRAARRVSSDIRRGGCSSGCVMSMARRWGTT